MELKNWGEEEAIVSGLILGTGSIFFFSEAINVIKIRVDKASGLAPYKKTVSRYEATLCPKTANQEFFSCLPTAYLLPWKYFV
jgi:hypothetical protein